jgi:type I restriction enzyme S subunit
VGKYALLARDMAFLANQLWPKNYYPFFIYLLVGFIVDDLLTAAMAAYLTLLRQELSNL